MAVQISCVKPDKKHWLTSLIGTIQLKFKFNKIYISCNSYKIQMAFNFICQILHFY